MKCELVVPIRSFNSAMLRLKDSLKPEHRCQLMHTSAKRVIAAGKSTSEIDRITVISPEKDLFKFANELDVDFHLSKEVLNCALNKYRIDNAYSRLIVSLADLYFVNDFDDIVESLYNFDAVIACDRHRQGSNVYGVQKKCNIDFQFGFNSYSKHVEQLKVKQLSYQTIKNYKYAFDIDTAKDLVFLDKKWGQ